MTPEQSELLEQVRALLEEQPQIEAAWLAGSLGRGGGDEWSDVDLVALCPAGTRSEVSPALTDAVRQRFEPLLLNVLYGGVVLNVVTPDWQRFDVTVIEPDGLGRQDPARLSELFNRSGARPSGQVPASYKPTAESVLPIVEEFLRIVGLAPLASGRDDPLLMILGMEHLRRLTTDLMLEENRIGPWDRGGMLSRNALLTEEQYAQLAGLPPLSADLASIKATQEALAAIFLPRARRLCAEVGAAYPERFEAATRTRVLDHLGWSI